MTTLYPLRMLPAFDPRPWGTTDLSPIYPDHKFAEKIGEAWLTGDHCKVANGPLAGRTLSELSKQCGRGMVGDAARDPERFPLLLKFLFPTRNFRCRCILMMSRHNSRDNLGERPNAGMSHRLSPDRRWRWGSGRV